MSKVARLDMFIMAVVMLKSLLEFKVVVCLSFFQSLSMQLTILKHEWDHTLCVLVNQQDSMGFPRGTVGGCGRVIE